MKINVKLLKHLNDNKDENKSSLMPKYIAVVTASDINTYLKYDKIKSKNKNPFKIKSDSIIKIDSQTQRGLDEETKAVLQEKTKVEEIKEVLLGTAEGIRRKAFLGCLIWNVRKSSGTLKKRKISPEDSKYEEYDLSIDTTEGIYLPDSAHRHLGICEATIEFSKSPEKYPDFDPNFEFPVEIYHLSPNQEKELFLELNSKQKKVTAAKRLQIDSSSPAGYLKEIIIQKDKTERGLFDENIEVTTNTNDKHTLVTMAVFVASIKEMFGSDIKSIIDDESSAEEYADYFKSFFYELQDKIHIKIDGNEIKPFRNLYKEIIVSEECDLTDETEINAFYTPKREKAAALNKELRDVDIIVNNQMFKTLAHIGGLVRTFKNPLSIIDLIQRKLLLPTGGKYFQASNHKLLESLDSTFPPIATVKGSDGALNVQVTPPVLKACKHLMVTELDLNFENNWDLCYEGEIIEVKDNITKVVIGLSKSHATSLGVGLSIITGFRKELLKENLKIKIQPMHASGEVLDWDSGTFTGKKMVQCSELTEVSGFSHPTHSDNVKLYKAQFNVDIPAFNLDYNRQFLLNVSIKNEDFLDASSEFKILCQPKS